MDAEPAEMQDEAPQLASPGVCAVPTIQGKKRKPRDAPADRQAGSAVGPLSTDFSAFTPRNAQPVDGARPTPFSAFTPAAAIALRAPLPQTMPGPAAARPIPAEPPPTDGIRIVAPADLRHACEMLREDVAQLALPLEVDGVDAARRALNALLSQLDDYLLPRLRRIDAPLLAVVGGSTGAGKSTLVNSLVRRVVSRSGVLRPTTRSPVLIHHPYDSGAFFTQRILPGLARVTSEAPEPLQPIDVDAPPVTALRLVPDEGLAPGLAVIDAPDIDSLVETNRDLAVQLLAAADLWIFVTTAARYSDAVPWDLLKTAVDRGVSVAVVLDRVPKTAMNEVRIHLAQLLRDRGLSTAPLFTIPEATKDADGFLPAGAVAPLRGWLNRLARDSRSRDVVVRRTLVGALDSLHDRVRVIAAAAEQQATARARLSSSFVAAFDGGERRLAVTLGNGSLLRGEVLARWQEYTADGEVFRGLDGTAPRLLDRVTAVVSRTRPVSAGPLADSLRTGIEAAVSTSLRATVERIVTAWRKDPVGRGVLLNLVGGPEVLPDVASLVGRTVADWQAAVLEQAHREARGRWTTARSAGLGAEGAAVMLQILALGSAASTPAPIVEVAGRVLRAVLGDETDILVAAARDDLVARASWLLAAERDRFAMVLERDRGCDDLAMTLRSHLRAIERAR